MSWISRLTNAAPMSVLHSPVHRLMSGRYAVIEFTGRRSGRTYRTPIAYVRDGSRVLLSTDSSWSCNLPDRPEVRLRLRGTRSPGTLASSATTQKPDKCCASSWNRSPATPGRPVCG